MGLRSMRPIIWACKLSEFIGDARLFPNPQERPFSEPQGMTHITHGRSKVARALMREHRSGPEMPL